MEFRSYGKTKNVSEGSFINKMVSKYPELSDSTYVLTEKLDGTNFTLFFDEEGNVGQGSRNRELTIDLTHFDYHSAVLDQYSKEISAISNFCKEEKVSVRIYGELFGQGILHRITYGPKKFLPFQLEAEDGDTKILIPVDKAMKWMEDVVGYTWWVPVITKIKGLDNALAYEVDSFWSREIEGVIIEPYEQGIDDPVLGKFKLKLKTRKFCDKESIKQKKPKDPVELSEKAAELLDIYKGYFNVNRVLDMVAKEGPLTEMSQMGKYIKLIAQDAREDLLKDHKELFCSLTDTEKKVILGCAGKTAAPIVQQVIKGEGTI